MFYINIPCHFSSIGGKVGEVEICMGRSRTSGENLSHGPLPVLLLRKDRNASLLSRQADFMFCFSE